MEPNPAARQTDLFVIERDGDILILTPQKDLREFEYQHIESGAREVLDMLGKGTVNNLVMDFHKTDYYGSTALGFFIKLWKRVRSRNGQLAFCNVSAHEMEVLRATSLASLWPICASRQEAIEAVKRSAAE
jgi:anti-anti-sigma factor